MKKFRFFYHYNKQQRKMSVHFKRKCYIVTDIICQPECQTHYRNSQPYLVMRGWTTNVLINNDSVVIM